MKKDNVKPKQATPLSAVKTRNILAAVLVILILGAAAGFYFGLQMVRDYSVVVSHAVSDSVASGKNVEQLGQLKQQLANGQALVSKADQLFATPDTYQTQALKDISKYASQSGVTITSIDTAKPAAATTTTTGTTTPPPATTAAATSYSEVITIQSPVAYTSFLKFLDAIEGNLPKMQITGITIGRPANGTNGQITTDKITITVAVR